MIHIYCFSSTKTILISDRPSDKIKDKYGRQYEILNSVRDKSSVPVILNRISRSYSGYTIIEWYTKVRVAVEVSDETRAKMSAAKLGKSRSAESNAKTSATMKGRSNFRGKKHSEETKEKISEKMMGNSTDLIWCHHPVTGEEKRVADITLIPDGWLIGREYYSVEGLLLGRQNDI